MRWFVLFMTLICLFPLSAGVTPEQQPLIYREFFGVPKGSTVKMTVDGQDVTSDCRVSDTRIEYRPPRKLAVGTHEVVVSVTTPQGRTHQVDWTFEIDPTVQRVRPQIKFLPPSPRNGSRVSSSVEHRLAFEISSSHYLDRDSLHVLVFQGGKIIHRLNEGFRVEDKRSSRGSAQKTVVETPLFALDPGRVRIHVMAQDRNQNSLEGAWRSFTVIEKETGIQSLKVVLVDNRNRSGLEVSGSSGAPVEVTVKGQRPIYTVQVPVNGGRFEHFIEASRLPKVFDSWDIVAQTDSKYMAETVVCPDHWPHKLSARERLAGRVNQGLDEESEVVDSARGLLRRPKALVQPGPYLIEGQTEPRRSLLVSVDGRTLKKIRADSEGHYKGWVSLIKEGDLRGLVSVEGATQQWPFQVIVDGTPPFIRPRDFSQGARLKNNRQVLNFAVSDKGAGWDVSGVALTLNGRAWRPQLRQSGSNLAIELTDLLEVGPQEMTVAVTDRAGNTSRVYSLDFEVEDLVRGKGARLLAQRQEQEDESAKEELTAEEDSPTEEVSQPALSRSKKRRSVKR